jgi:hypothetical protein
VPQYRPEPSTTDQLMVYGGSSLGVALLLGACVLGVVRTHRE